MQGALGHKGRMQSTPEIICIGAVLWDVIGRAPQVMERGNDVAGRITRRPGGVAMNIALALVRQGVRTGLLTALGNDPEGDELLALARNMGLHVDHVFRSELPTDRYMAVEGENGLIAAIADAHSLESAGARILAPLTDGRLAAPDAAWRGMVALDGNLTTDLLREISESPAFAQADLRLAPASPGKAERLAVFLGHQRATLYLNLEEACILTGTQHRHAADAARAVLETGVGRVLVTNGAKTAALAGRQGVICADPPRVTVHKITGAGDTFMAAHMAAELRGETGAAALNKALSAAAEHISTPLFDKDFQ